MGGEERGTRPLTQVEVEQEGQRLSRRLEAQTEKLAEAARNAAIGEASYKIAFAKAITTVQAPNAQEREAKAMIQCEEEYRLYKSTEREFIIAQEGCRTLRAQLDWLRSVNANIRYQVTGGS